MSLDFHTDPTQKSDYMFSLTIVYMYNCIYLYNVKGALSQYKFQVAITVCSPIKGNHNQLNSTFLSKIALKYKKNIDYSWNICSRSVGYHGLIENRNISLSVEILYLGEKEIEWVEIRNCCCNKFLGTMDKGASFPNYLVYMPRKAWWVNKIEGVYGSFIYPYERIKFKAECAWNAVRVLRFFFIASLKKRIQ